MIDPAPKPTPEAPVPPTAGAESAPSAPEIDPNKLTPEEQLARFEKELKETDWGHQPC